MAKALPFLTAEWRFLLMLNYEVDAAVLEPLVPAGTELDLWEGKALVSMVGFLFLRSRVLGVGVPFHRNFEEVNLRFYVRRQLGEESRGGICFVKEIVPLKWVAQAARFTYQENYQTMRMGHTVEGENNPQLKDRLVEYTWRYRRRLNRLGGLGTGEPKTPAPGSEAWFLSERLWGYTRLSDSVTSEYHVEHPLWRVWAVTQPYLLCDIAALYGDAFSPFLHHRPRSAFLAEGSPVAVFPRQKFKGKRPGSRS